MAMPSAETDELARFGYNRGLDRSRFGEEA